MKVGEHVLCSCSDEQSNHNLLSLCLHRKAPRSPLFPSGYLIPLTQPRSWINLKPALPEADFGGKLQADRHLMDTAEEGTHISLVICTGFGREHRTAEVRDRKHPPRAAPPAALRAHSTAGTLHSLPEGPVG